MMFKGLVGTLSTVALICFGGMFLAYNSTSKALVNRKEKKYGLNASK